MNAGPINGGSGNTSKSEVYFGNIARVRLVLSIFALLFFALDEFDSSHLNVAAYKLISVLYFFYAALHCMYAKSMQKIVPPAGAHWVDAACFALLINLSDGLTSPLFYFFFFAIFVATFVYGFMEGLKLTAFCILLSILIHLFSLYSTGISPLYPELVYQVSLLILGYFIICWGIMFVQQKAKLKLLCEVSCMPDLHLSAEQLMGNSLEHIRDFYHADSGLAVVKMPDGNYMMFKVFSDTEKPMQLGIILDEGIAEHLLAIPPQWSIYYANEAEWVTPSLLAHKPSKTLLAEKSNFGEAISHLLEVDSFASTPLHLHGQDIGRLYLTNCRRSFNAADMRFLQQLVNQITPRIGNMHLLDKIATATTSEMRKKISIDLHDSAIQPYIGLMLGLQALRRKIPQDEAIAAEVDELINMTAESIAELRQYIGGLESHLEMPLVPAIIGIAKKYQHRHGIDVAINADPELIVSGSLANEVYQVVREGLSNIHRHTEAKQAEINLYYQHHQLVIEVINQDDSSQDFIHFIPRSMTERVAQLGGKVSVNRYFGDKAAEGKTIVIAKIPFPTKEKRYAEYD